MLLLKVLRGHTTKHQIFYSTAKKVILFPRYLVYCETIYTELRENGFFNNIKNNKNVVNILLHCIFKYTRLRLNN